MRVLLLPFLLLLGIVVIQAQTEAPIHQVVHSISDQVHIAIDNNHQVNIKETYSNVIIIEVIVAISNANKAQTEEWIRTGRYHVLQEEKDGVVFLRSKKKESPIYIDGAEATEYITYNISVPEYMDWKLEASSTPKEKIRKTRKGD